MKNNLFKIALILSIFLISCSPEDKLNIVEHDSIIQDFPTQIVELKNYENSGVDFLITPINRDKFLKAKASYYGVNKSSESITYAYELTSSTPSKTDIITTELVINKKSDGTMSSTHFLEEKPLAILTYDSDGRIIDIILPDDNTEGMLLARPTYSCINREYQRLKVLLENDMINEIVCNLTYPICRALMVMTAVEICRGNL